MSFSGAANIGALVLARSTVSSVDEEAANLHFGCTTG